MASDEVTVGIDIGGTRIKAVAVGPDGRVLSQQVAPTCDDERSLVLCVGRIVEEIGAFGAVIGISAPGIAATDNRSIAWMRGRMQVVEGLVWREQLAREAWVLNDAHAAALGEAWSGAAQGRSPAIVLTLGTGVGGGVVIDGQVFQGATGRAGHLGHITLDANGRPDIVGMPGSLEDCIGDHTVLQRTDGRFRSTVDLVRAARDGDAFAAECWRRSVRGLAVGIASLINVFDPQIVVVGGGIAACGPMLMEPLAECLNEVEWRPTGQRVPVVAAKLGELAGAIGAARFAAQQSSEVDR